MPERDVQTSVNKSAQHLRNIMCCDMELKDNLEFLKQHEFCLFVVLGAKKKVVRKELRRNHEGSCEPSGNLDLILARLQWCGSRLWWFQCLWWWWHWWWWDGGGGGNNGLSLWIFSITGQESGGEGNCSNRVTMYSVHTIRWTLWFLSKYSQSYKSNCSTSLVFHGRNGLGWGDCKIIVKTRPE